MATRGRMHMKLVKLAASSRFEAKTIPEDKAIAETEAPGSMSSKHSSEPAMISASDEETGDWDSWDPMAEDFLSTKNTLAVNPDTDPVSTITGKSRPLGAKIGNALICDHYSKYGECADGKYCDRLHIDPKSRDKIWQIQEAFENNKGRTCMNYTFLSPLEIEPDPSSLLLVSVTSVKTPGDFHIVAPYESMNFAQFTLTDMSFYMDRVELTSSMKVKLQRFNEQLTALFDHPYRIDNVNDDIYQSQVVACKLKDGHFCRALVIDTPCYASDVFDYKLFLLDFGTEINMPRELIYDIKAHCLSEPPLALNCRLSVGPVEVDSGWTEHSIEFFECKARGNRYMLCKLADYSDYDRIFTADLYDIETRSSLTDEMVEKGFARRL